MNNKKTFHTLASLTYLLACGILVSCNGGSARPADAPSALTVDAVVAEPRHFELSLDATGNIRPYEEVELRAPLGGTVLDILFEEGRHVKKGDLLIRIDDRAWQAEAKGLRARIEVAGNDLKRRQALLEIEGASQEEVDAASAVLSGLEAQLEQLEVNIGLANVRAPFSGMVGLRDFSLGTYLSEGAVITQLAQVDKLKLDFDLPGKYADKVMSGKRVTVISGRDTGQATVYAVNPSVNNTSRTLRVRAVMGDDHRGFTPGDFAKVVFTLDVDTSAILIPSDAVMPELNGQSVFVLQDGKAQRRSVTLGTRTAGEVQVLKGLSAGDSVIVSGLLQVKDGMRVNAKTASKP